MLAKALTALVTVLIGIGGALALYWNHIRRLRRAPWRTEPITESGSLAGQLRRVPNPRGLSPESDPLAAKGCGARRQVRRLRHRPVEVPRTERPDCRSTEERRSHESPPSSACRSVPCRVADHRLRSQMAVRVVAITYPDPDSRRTGSCGSRLHAVRPTQSPGSLLGGRTRPGSRPWPAMAGSPASSAPTPPRRAVPG
jgi:hypothetical protein